MEEGDNFQQEISGDLSSLRYKLRKASRKDILTFLGWVGMVSLCLAGWVKVFEFVLGGRP